MRKTPEDANVVELPDPPAREVPDIAEAQDEHAHCRWKSDPDRGDYFKRTPLFLAVVRGDLEIVKVLLAH